MTNKTITIKQSSLLSENLPIVIIYKFCKKSILIQPPGEPREHHPSEVRTKVRAMKNVIQTKMANRVDILWRIFEKFAKQF